MMLENIRTALLISLTILVLVMFYKWYKRRVMARELPTPIHAELISVEVMYHPSVLRVEVVMPRKEELFPAMLSNVHAPLFRWPAVAVEKGRHVLELPLEEVQGEGIYYFELATSGQRTERRFIVRTSL